MRTLCDVSRGLAWAASVLFVLSIVAMGCGRPPFPQCRDDDDCKAEEGNTTLLVCINGQCQECGKDEDCPKDRPHCKDNRCVECFENSHCPEDRPFCENNRCVYECEIDSDCEKRGKTGMVCKDHKCQQFVPECACRSDDDCSGGMVCRDCACVEKPSCQLETIHFDFDRYELRAGDREILDRNAECLKQRPDNKILIEGHCDERGTEEYNVALGDKRARAAQNYLKNLGIGGNRLKTISYGEGRPTCQESNEDCWGQNRRAQLGEQ